MRPFAVDSASGTEAQPGRKDPAKVAALFAAVGAADTSSRRHERGRARGRERDFGPYGGRFVPETLIPALDELEAAWLEARSDPAFGARAGRRCCATTSGGPTPLYLAQRLSERVGGKVYLKREDLLHTGAHKINNAIGQALLAKRMGKRRVIAETGAGQHGVAAATACALLDLECVVYMGTEDMRRQRPNVERMGLLGAEVAPVEAGARTLKEAVSAAIRDWVANVATTHYIIGSAVGPSPYPALVRDLQRVIGDEIREQVQAAEGRLPDRVIACVGGGSNAIGAFAPFVRDEGVELIGVEAAGEGLDSGRHSAPLTTGARGVLHGAMSAVLQDDDGQVLEAHSISAGLDYPGVGPEHAWLRDEGRVRYDAVPDEAALEAFRRLARMEGIIPRARAGARARVAAGEPGRRASTCWCSRGAGDKDLAEVLVPVSDRIAAAFAGHGRRAALMPYLMGGHPDPETSLAACEAAADAGADLIELGVPFSDPLADGPVIHAAATEALANGVTPSDVLRQCEAVADRLPVVLMVYANVVLAAGLEDYARAAAGAGAAGTDRARPAARRGRRAARGLRRGGARAGAAGRAHHHSRAAGGDRRGRARVRLHRVAHRDDRRARRAPARPDRHRRARRGRPPRLRWRWASASRPRRTPRRWRTSPTA